MLNLIGVHECKMDAKGRIAIPAGLKKQLLPVMEQGFVLKRSVFQPCLELFPIQEWEKTMGKVNKLNRFIKKNNDFIRMYTAGVKLLDVDGSNRLNIPRDLMTYAHLNNEIVLSSAVGMIEVWDKSRYEASLKSMVDDFGQLAEDVMGSLNEPDGLS
jgi:MraZ protein